ncbi:MAG: lysophospholipid acyltransferase family protein [Acidobacteriota bacterium]
MTALRARARALVRFALLAAVTLALWAAGILWSLPRETRAARRVRMARVWARAALRILGVRVHALGRAPAAPCLLVANHLSYLDILVVGAHTDATFVSKDDVADWPVVGRLARFAGTVFLRRARGSAVAAGLEATAAALRDGRTVVVFPEGTSTDGHHVLPFRPALIEAAARARRPIGWAAIAYETGRGDPPASRAVCWWGDMTLPGHLFGLLQLTRIDARLAFGRLVPPGPDRKVLARQLHHAVRRALPVQSVA